MKFLADRNSGNLSLPATSGVVQTATPPIPPSERSKLIRINRELQNKPIVLGGGDVSPLCLTWKTSTLWGMADSVGLSLLKTSPLLALLPLALPPLPGAASPAQ
jgi:hypothetical protein